MRDGSTTNHKLSTYLPSIPYNTNAHRNHRPSIVLLPLQAFGLFIAGKAQVTQFYTSVPVSHDNTTRSLSINYTRTLKLQLKGIQ